MSKIVAKCGIIVHNTPMKNNFSERLRIIKMNIAYYRRLRGFTQEGLAERLDVSRTHLSNIEAPNMSVGIKLEMLFAISDALGIDITQLFEIR